MQECVHRRKQVGIVGAGAQDHLAVAERILDSLCHIVACEVGKGYFHSLLAQFVGYIFGSLQGIAVYRSRNDKHALGLHAIRAPYSIQAQRLRHLLTLQHRTVQRSDSADTERSHLLKHSLYLHAVLAYYIEVVSPCLACPVVGIGIIYAELAERVGGEQHFLLRAITHQHLGPVHHRRSDELQRQAAQVEHVALLYYAYITILHAKLAKHVLGNLRAYDLHAGIGLHETFDRSRVIRLHVMDYQIIGLTAEQGFLRLVQPLVGTTFVNRIQNGYLVGT